MSIIIPALGRVPYGGGCVTEPAFFALNYLVHWRADLTIAGQVYASVPVLDTLRDVLARPEHYGVTRGEALAAREQFLAQAGQALAAEGGQADWLVKEWPLPEN